MPLRRVQKNRVAAALLLLLCAVLIGSRVRSILPELSYLPLVTVIMLAFFLEFAELFLVCAFSLLLLNWKPMLTPEMVIVALFPLIVWAVRRFLPGRAWIGNMLCSSVGIAFIIGLSSPSFAISNPAMFIIAIATGAVSGTMLFFLFHYFYAPNL